ncbi:MAG: sigma-70 family RNA polymerase sigma factor [Saprospiraceae bacterium]|nr:sigma-70 family RNA polymerase sigma factor [Saprospiraceae bacterium]
MKIGYQHTDTDNQLISLLKAGDEGAYAKLYDDYSSLLYGIILRVVGDKRDAENLLQDCFVKVWQNAERYDAEKGRLATWLINIARNTAIDFTRSKYYAQKTKNQTIDNFVDKDTGASAHVIPVDTLGLRQLVKKLPPACREVIEWMYFEGYTQQEIADNFNIPLGTVKLRARTAMQELRQYYK